MRLMWAPGESEFDTPGLVPRASENSHLKSWQVYCRNWRAKSKIHMEMQRTPSAM